MAHIGNNAAIQAADRLLRQYGFDLDGSSVEVILDRWLRHFPPRWIRLALIEALYLGRYKAISVEQILELWQRREQPIYHFNSEFEAIICQSLPISVPEPTPSRLSETPSNTKISEFHPDLASDPFVTKLTSIVQQWQSQDVLVEQGDRSS
ncbi:MULTISPECIES: hypothetical protein [unclassified Thermosynechococcus]|uniref:hypothetical protein n=1 Tax=unclassified Thermosynechococcus TaxID=2622553 RepID=UPI0026737DFF|nr:MULTISPECIES: hypothetical protein [unclassified Thermosynechococcus]WKT84250.1 hypothetical protein QYC28_02705 [Thermosynechococcus sp. HY596]WNC63384.1 hypothetical protein RHK13_02705 [Thermosynechococcus sp. HY591]WNC65945.1 hypothetical protein RHK28_02715 [Thermosynechococcus sp. HY593]